MPVGSRLRLSAASLRLLDYGSRVLCPKSTIARDSVLRTKYDDKRLVETLLLYTWSTPKRLNKTICNVRTVALNTLPPAQVLFYMSTLDRALLLSSQH